MTNIRAIVYAAIVTSTLGCTWISGCAAGGNSVPSGNADGGAGGGSGGQGGAIDFGDGGPPEEPEMYVNSLDKLYRFDPIKKEVKEIGAFDCVIAEPSGTADGGMHDLAVTKGGELYGVAKLGPQGPNSVSSAHVIVSIDKTTGHCTKIWAVPADLVDPQGSLEIRGLSFVPAGTLNASDETLVALEIYGHYIAIDLASKTAQVVGTLTGNGSEPWTTKGADIVSLILDKTYVTAKLQSPNDNLAVMDPKTGMISANIGETAFTTVGGLAYWGGTLYGFTVEGGIYAIDPKTGLSSGLAVAAPSGIAYHGAGVTTAAPILPPK